MKGQAILAGGHSLWESWTDGKGTLLVLSEGEHKGWRLSYDHTGQTRNLRLVKDVGPGCLWTFEEFGCKNLARGFETRECKARAHPKNGPFAGWEMTSRGGSVVMSREGPGLRFNIYYDDLRDGK